KRNRIFARGVCYLVDERLEHKRQGVAARRPQGIGRHAARHERCAKRVIADEAAGKFGGAYDRGRSEILIGSQAGELAVPGGTLGGGVGAWFKVVKAGRAVMVVMEIVFASPEQFNGYADFLRDRRRFQHVIVGESSAEPAARAAQVHVDVALVDFKQLGYLA